MDLLYYLLYIVLCCLATVVKESQARDWPCTSAEDCTPIIGSSCSALGLCQCASGFIFSGDFSNCLREASYGEDCVESAQCTFPGASCDTNVCACQNGYQYLRGRCRQFSLLNDPCKEDADCYFGYDTQSVSCVSGACSCAEGYYQRYNSICRRKSEIQGPCVVNSDCGNSGSVCFNFMCAAANASITVNSRDAARNQEERKITKATYISGHNKYSAVNKGLGEVCSNAQEKCSDLEHSICAGGRCMCQAGYFENNGLCFAELGEIAMSELLCEHFFDAESGLCLCPENFFVEPGLRDCRKPIVAEDGRCTSDSQCSPFGASICSEVRPRICVCEKFAEYDESLQMCVPAKGLGSYCESSDNCYVTNSACSDDVCVCSDLFIPLNETCVPGLGASCRSSEECITEYSVCDETKNVCMCKDEYIEHQNSCLKKASSIGDHCSENIQCQPILGELAECMNSTCNCNDDGHVNEGVCFNKRTIGESCKSSSECFVPKNQYLVECRNAICECSYGYERDESTNTCEKQGRNSSGLARGAHIIHLITFVIVSSIFHALVARE